MGLNPKPCGWEENSATTVIPMHQYTQLDMCLYIQSCMCLYMAIPAHLHMAMSASVCNYVEKLSFMI